MEDLDIVNLIYNRNEIGITELTFLVVNTENKDEKIYKISF